MPYTFRYGDRPLEGVTVQRAVGRGGFGEVYYALTDSGKQVALKYLRQNPEIELRGIAQVMNLKSPHLITIYDVRRNAASEPFVLMEYVSGPSLRELLTAAPNGLGPQKAAYFIDGIAKGLAYLHDRGIVHRDLKPANIFYDDGYVKIGDYGLSKHISVSRHSGQTVSVGTVHYMAPEIGSGSYTKAIDIYAVGVILYEMLTGRLPFSGSSMGEILMRHLSDQPDLAGIPEPFAAVIAKALAKDPRDRYQDANEMADALRQFADVNASIASFDHSTLNNVPRRDDANDAEQTVTTTPHQVPPPPPMDIWAPPSGRADVLAEKLQKKMERISRKFQHKADKLARRRGMNGARRMRWSPELDQVVNARVARTNRLGQLFVILALMGGVATGLSFIRGGPNWDEVAAGLFCCIAASVAGPLVIYFRLLRRSPVQHGLWDRLAYVAMTAVMLVPAFGMASDFVTAASRHPADVSVAHKPERLDDALKIVIDDDGVRAPQPPRAPAIRSRLHSVPLVEQLAAEYADRNGHFMNMLVAPLAMLLFCDWTRRIRTGQMGEVRARDAVWPGVVGLIAASIASADSFHFAAAAICATASLLTQAGAAIWPVAARVTEADAAQPADAAIRVPSMQPVADRGAHAPVAPESASGPPGTGAPANSPKSSTKLPPPIVIDASPSIFGRLMNTGIAFAAKLLLVLGLALAMGHDALQQRVAVVSNDHTGCAAVATGAANGLPARALLAIPLLGALLLVFSRRHDGGMHLLRGCVGGALGLGAAIIALGPAAPALAAFFSSDHWAALEWDQLGPPLAFTAAPLLAAILLLTWPRRQSDTIVV